MWGREVDGLEHLVDARVDVVDLLFEALLEEGPDGEVEVLAGNDLSRRRHGHAVRPVDLTRFRLCLARDEAEEGGLARTVLAHEGHLHSATHGKAGLDENRLVVAVLIGDLVETENCVIFGHVSQITSIRGMGQRSRPLYLFRRAISLHAQQQFSRLFYHQHGESRG